MSVIADRTSRWGNPWSVSLNPVTRGWRVCRAFARQAREGLEERCLACWCPLDGPYCAGVLLRVARAEEVFGG